MSEFPMIMHIRAIVDLGLLVCGSALFMMGFLLVLLRIRANFRMLLKKVPLELDLRSDAPGLLFIVVGAFVLWIAAGMRLEIETSRTTMELAQVPRASVAAPVPAAPPAQAGAPPAVPAPTPAPPRSVTGARAGDDAVTVVTRITQDRTATRFVDGSPLTRQRVVMALDAGVEALAAQRDALGSDADPNARARNRVATNVLAALGREMSHATND